MNQVEPLQEVMFDPEKHSSFPDEKNADGEQHSDGSFTFRVSPLACLLAQSVLLLVWSLEIFAER